MDNGWWRSYIASTENILHSHEKGNFGGVVEAIGGTLRTPHMNSDRTHAYFGRRRRVGSTEVLKRVAWEGVSAEI